MNREKLRVDVIIPAYRPDARFLLLMRRLFRQSVRLQKVIIMNTERELWERSGVEAELRRLGILSHCELHHIRKAEFDHGHTRNLGVRYSDAPCFIMMTQDAVPADEYLIERLLEPLLPEKAASPGGDVRNHKEACAASQGAERGGGRVALSYGRQLPNRDADAIERLTRAYNYPAKSFTKGIEDLPRLGIKTFFASDVCAAYDRAVFDRLGGFTDRAIFNEDMIYAAGLLRAGYRIAYAAEARVRHSHNYSPAQQLHRNFDLAVSQAEHPEVFSGIRSEGEGIRMVLRTAKGLCREGHAGLLPRLVLLSGAKYLGYRLGKSHRALPRKLTRRLSMSPGYWDRRSGQERADE